MLYGYLITEFRTTFDLDKSSVDTEDMQQGILITR